MLGMRCVKKKKNEQVTMLGMRCVKIITSKSQCWECVVLKKITNKSECCECVVLKKSQANVGNALC